MKIINILSNDLKLVREQNRLSVYSNTGKLVSYPLSFFDGIFCFSNISLTTPLIKFLSANGKYIAFFSQTGKLSSIIFPLEKQSGLNNRIKQFQVYSSEKEALNFCKKLIERKLIEIEKNFSIDTSTYIKKIHSAENKDSILGIEGTASALMFKAFKEKLSETGVEFNGRDYFPPPDEVNSILSFLYSYFYHVTTAILYIKGFDPYLGILHSKKGYHHAFSSDIVEVARPSLTLSAVKIIRNFGLENIKFIREESAVYVDTSSIKDIILWINRYIFDKQVEIISSFLQEIFKQPQ